MTTLIVAVDGSGDYRTVQEAVNQVPADNAAPITIRIKNGVYKEKLHIEKPFITLIGEDAEGTVLEYDDYARKTYPNGDTYNTFNSYSVLIATHDFHAENLTIANTAGKGEVVGQAVAAYVDGDRISFRNCRFLGHQDTLFTGPLPPKPVERSSFGGPRDNGEYVYGRQYYESCYIEGDVDFIFGSATAVFKDCEIFAKNRLTPENAEQFGKPDSIHGFLTAASTPEHVPFGYVFLDCRLTGDAPPQSYRLGRPWRIYAKTVFVRCWMGEHIRSEGWDNWNKPEAEETTVYAEYGSTGPGGAAAERVSWSKQLSPEEASAYTIENVLSGADQWDPQHIGGVKRA